MNAAAATLFADGFMQGLFNVMGAMVSAPASYAQTDCRPLTPEVLHTYLSQFTVAVQAPVASGGAVVVLAPAVDMGRLVTLVTGERVQTRDRLADSQLPSVREVWEPCLGGGAAYIKETYGQELPLAQATAVSCGPESAAELAGLLGDRAVAASFMFSVPPEIQSEGVLLFSEPLVAVIPPGALARPAPSEHYGQLGDAEVDDILNRVGATPPPPGAPRPASILSGRVLPGNLDMVLDIRLVATARLGRVELPISEILALGPGSIIEVGHLVDEPVELLVNDKLIARGDVVVVDEKFGLRITEIVSAQERIESLGR